MAKTVKFLGGRVMARAMKPTRKHRVAVYECMLGTLYAVNERGVEKYFDYDWEAALAYANVAPGCDPRLYRQPSRRYAPKNKLKLYVLREKHRETP